MQTDRKKKRIHIETQVGTPIDTNTVGKRHACRQPNSMWAHRKTHGLTD